ncbi:hypothetical protein BDQ17DRAFT_1388134 [Cyathus striatus]|nr:hypothetical protein BDQ17DRAFT_1388134 [Cyathus striatus]
MAEPSRGLPLLSGFLPHSDPQNAELACRKCNKEFNILFTRARRCNHCGYSYCHSCSDFQALMPRSGTENGYDAANVCGFCIEFLAITAGGKSYLKSLPLSKLKRYITAYNIKINGAVEKDDLIEAIVTARGPNGCLPAVNESFYRKYSVPNRTAGQRPRGIFSRPGQSSSSSAPPPPPRPAPQPTYHFPRPDLEPDFPPHQQYAPPPGPPPSSYHYQAPPPQPQYSTYPGAGAQIPPQYHQYPPPPQPSSNPGFAVPPYAQPQPGYNPQYAPGMPGYQSPYNPYHTAPPPPPQRTRPSNQQTQHPTASQSSSNIPHTHQPPPPPPPPRPRTTSTATPTPPSLDDLLNMSQDAISALSIGALKSILFTNHVNAGMILEKSDLVQKVLTLVDDERRERDRQRAIEEAERLVREEQKRDRERQERVQAEQEQKEKDSEDNPVSTAGGSEGSGSGSSSSSGGRSTSPSSASPAPPPPTKQQVMQSLLERTGLCVICQDEEANIAIVDCGHLAMCRGCSDLVMASSKECPLCRTRIVTEARLLRIFKT